jgi:hypothetical protein
LNVIKAPGTNISLAFLFYEKYFSHQKLRNDAFEKYKRGQKLENLKKSFVVLKNMQTGLLLNLLSEGKNNTSTEAASRNHKTEGMLIIKTALIFTWSIGTVYQQSKG